MHQISYVFSSLWNGLTPKFHVAKDDTISLIGNGDVTNFWLDKWCGEQSFVELLSILSAQHQSHSDRVDMFIQNHQWMIPQEIANHFPAMRFLIGRVVIPLEDKPNNLIWIGIDFGNLSLKEAFSFKTKVSSQPHWLN